MHGSRASDGEHAVISLGWSHLIVGLGAFYAGMTLMGMCQMASEADRRECLTQPEADAILEAGQDDRYRDDAPEVPETGEPPISWDPAWGDPCSTPERRER